jgi:pSer/pThr/pTyr-binding forkhead associated (FHA) protein
MTENHFLKIPLKQKQVFLVHEHFLYRIEAPITFLGRHPTNNIILNAPTISRFHARIKYEDGWFSLYDFGSKFGTYLNGTQVKTERLKTGDKIRLADIELTFIEETRSLAKRSKRTTGELVMVKPNSQYVLALETHS